MRFFLPFFFFSPRSRGQELERGAAPVGEACFVVGFYGS